MRWTAPPGTSRGAADRAPAGAPAPDREDRPHRRRFSPFRSSSPTSVCSPANAPSSSLDRARPSGYGHGESNGTGPPRPSGRRGVSKRRPGPPRRRTAMAWNMSGTYAASCHCRLVCPCPVDGKPTGPGDTCRGAGVFHVASGNLDDTDLSGIDVALVNEFPSNISAGDIRSASSSPTARPTTRFPRWSGSSRAMKVARSASSRRYTASGWGRRREASASPTATGPRTRSATHRSRSSRSRHQAAPTPQSRVRRSASRPSSGSDVEPER